MRYGSTQTESLAEPCEQHSIDVQGGNEARTAVKKRRRQHLHCCRAVPPASSRAPAECSSGPMPILAAHLG